MAYIHQIMMQQYLQIHRFKCFKT